MSRFLPAVLAAREAAFGSDEPIHSIADRRILDLQNAAWAARFEWEQRELGSAEAWRFAYRNRTPIVPPGHCCHPDELVKRGFIDGVGWPNQVVRSRVVVVEPNRMYGYNHYYVKVDGIDFTDSDGNSKWNTAEEARRAGESWLARKIQEEEEDAK